MKAVCSHIVSFDLHKDTWTAITAPWACSYYMILCNNNASAMLRCSDTDDARTSYTMQPWGWFFYSLPALYKRYRFAQGDTVTFLKATQDGTTVTVEFYN